jgi:quercetin dioxygenase-like cupin family protein
MGDGGFTSGALAPAIDSSVGQRGEPLAGEMERVIAGRVMSNPISGERIVILESGDQTGGQLLAFDLFLPPGGHVPAGHVHPSQEERFTIVSGQMRFRLRRHTILVGPGETIRIPPGIAHWFGNASAGVTRARVEVRPALRMEEVLASSEAIGMATIAPGVRLPNPFDLARILLKFQREVAMPHAPAFLVRAALAPLAWLGERRAQGRSQYGPR